MMYSFLRSCNHRSHAGFTLIELLVVISIIGLLSSVVLVALQGARTKGIDATRTETAIQLRNALELYYSTYKTYPVSTGATIESLVAPGGALNTNGYMTSLSANFVAPGTYTQYYGTATNYELMFMTQTGGASAKNVGCNTTDYTNYNTNGYAYCLGNNPATQLGVAQSQPGTPQNGVSGSGVDDQ